MKHKKIFMTVLFIIVLVFTGIFGFKKFSLNKPKTIEVAPCTSVPDFAKTKTVQEKINLFGNFLKPIANSENNIILSNRVKLKNIEKFHKFNKKNITWLNSKAEYYRINEFSYKNKEDLLKLKNRMDIIPTPIILSQAAIESAWGTSGFAQRGNNLFGMRTLNQKEGFVPKERPKGARFRVAKYSTVNQSVRIYLRTLNTLSEYDNLRVIRENFRKKHEPIDPYILAEGLVNYSGLGEKYVRMVQRTMKHFYNENAPKPSDKMD
ncbi:MAG: glucosaminidase domain-containing protein [Candidatus Cloacimonadota bacterium]|nr:glucosaminidase domain-containing protein [Candidatus Cloacimonadota bacterium]